MNRFPTTATSPGGIGRRRTALKWLHGLWVASLLLLVGAAATLVLTGGFGRVTGEEFSAQTFQRRSFVYYQIPLFQIQVSPVIRVNTTNRLERYLSSQRLIGQPVPADRARWSVVRAARTESAWRIGDATILCNYLDQLGDDGDYVWLGRNHQQLAEHAAAVDCFTRALAYQERCSAALRGRAQSYTALGQPELAAKDRERLGLPRGGTAP